MAINYRGWTIDATPDFFFGKYFARARIVQEFVDDRDEPEMHIERDIQWFDHKDDAVNGGERWAMQWIDARAVGMEPPGLATHIQKSRQRSAPIADGLSFQAMKVEAKPPFESDSRKVTRGLTSGKARL